MLDTTTKKRIDDCRDILVGKLPDPKSQIEQITIALIYKFMDDMDKESVELGGKAKFFTNFDLPNPEDEDNPIKIEFEKYSWDNLFSPRVTAHDMLKLYSESIEKMEKNPNIPQLFRNIFKNAYLPYRDPETLKLFLKTIGEFKYTHSETLGDAFEYLLSVMGSQGDAGQFRTPRHIIDFIVKVVAPKKSDTILDPACGTAGFLVSAFKSIEKRNKGKLTPDERKKLIKNFIGYDISPDMVRMSLVNLYLHGFSNPHIFEYDSLTSEERWDNNFDVVLANPPFMSPKGGIRPHKRFSVTSNRSEVLFVDYIAEHLNPKGRAGIIVPEGIIFQSGKAYKELRKMLVETHLYAVVSLPAGVFNPYSGVKTSILLMDREIAKKKKEILFVKVENDGYNLGAQRNVVKGGQLAEAVELIDKFRNSKVEESPFAHAVDKKKIGENGEYNLSGERYRKKEFLSLEYPFVRISEICEINPESIDPYLLNTDNFVYIDISSVENGSGKVDFSNLIKKTDAPSRARRKVRNNDVILSTVRPNLKAFGIIYNPPANSIASTGFAVLRSNNNLNPRFLFYNLFTDKMVSQMINMMGKGAYPSINQKDVSSLQIPLPPLSVQEEIVAEIEGYQKIIDGAKMVVDNYKPKIEIDPEWEMVELGKVCDFIRGPFGGSLKKEIFVEKGYAVYEQSHAIYNQFEEFRYFVDVKKFNEMKRFEVNSNDLIMSCSGTMGKVSIVPKHAPKGIINQALLKLTTHQQKLLTIFLKLWMDSDNFQQLLHSNVHGAAIVNVASVKTLKALKLPLPDLETQKQIVSKIQKEQELVNSSKQLIEIFEQKIKDRIAKVWGKS